jgi:putative transposase
MSGIFSDKRRKEKQVDEGDKAKLFEEIGRLKIENDWLKKNLDYTVSEKRAAIDRDHKDISVSRQCELLGLSRSAYYYQAREIDTRDLGIMRLIDKEFTDHPFFGSRRLSDWLAEQGFPACRSKVSRLMKVMVIEPLFSLWPDECSEGTRPT